MILEMLCHFLIDLSDENMPDLNNNVTGLEPNDDESSFGATKYGEVSQISKDGKLYKDLTYETIETEDSENELFLTMLNKCDEENEVEEKFEIRNKFNIETLNDQISGF